MAQEQFKVNVAQHRGGYTIDNEDGTKEFAFVTNRQHAHLFADTGNRMVKLEAAAEFLAETTGTTVNRPLTPRLISTAGHASMTAAAMAILPLWAFQKLVSRIAAGLSRQRSPTVRRRNLNRSTGSPMRLACQPAAAPAIRPGALIRPAMSEMSTGTTNSRLTESIGKRTRYP